MIRLVISLAKDDKAWLQTIAENHHVSMAEVIRLAIIHYRSEMKTSKHYSFKELLKKTTGMWKREDGLKYQRKIRSEWDRD